MNTDKVIANYKAEYLRTSGKDITVTYHKGWFRISNNFTQNRRKEIIAFTEVLKARPTVTERIESVNGIPTLIKANQHVVKNILSGIQVIEDRDTPLACSVASETYHCM